MKANTIGMTNTQPAEGRMAWSRAWYGEQCRRGAHVHVAGRNARVLSARDGLLFVRIWNTGERVAVRPTEAIPA